MKKYRLKGGTLSITESAVFEEASREELRVLLALIERGFELFGIFQPGAIFFLCALENIIAQIFVHLLQHVLKTGTEGGILNAVDLTLQPSLFVIYGDSCTAGSQMGVIVNAEKYVA